MKFRSLFAITAITLAFVANVSAEITELTNKQDSTLKKNSNWSGLLGISGGNSLIAEDGTIFMSVRIGIQWNDFIANGAWTTFLLSDVVNPNVKKSELINYNAFGLFAELFPFRHNEFSVSIPIQVGGGGVNIIDQGDEAISPEEYFFTGEMAVHFNYRVTKMLEMSIGGGYRMFAGIDENNLDDMDFCSPFGELRFTFKE